MQPEIGGDETMMYDKDGNALVGLQKRGTKSYSPAQLGLNAVTLPASGSVESPWMDCEGYPTIVVGAVADKSFYIELRIAIDDAASVWESPGSSPSKSANQPTVIANQGGGASSSYRSIVGKKAKLVIYNQTANAGTATGHMHLQG